MPAPTTVKEAAQLLDDYDPKWYTKINTDELDMQNGMRCILAQTCGKYYDQHPMIKEWYAVGGPFSSAVDKAEWVAEIANRIAVKPSGSTAVELLVFIKIGNKTETIPILEARKLYEQLAVVLGEELI